MSEAYASVLPVVFADAFFVAASVMDEVVVDDDFLLLPVAFAGGEDQGTCVLQHGDQVWHDECLGEEVLCSAEEPWALPYPFLLGLVVVLAVALCDAEVSALQAFLDVEGPVFRCHPGFAFVGFALIDSGCVRPVHHGGRDELFDGVASSLNGQAIAVEVGRQQPFHLFVEVAYDERCDGLCDEVVAEHDVHAFLLGVRLYVFDGYLAEVGIVGVGVLLEVFAQVDVVIGFGVCCRTMSVLGESH